MAVVDAKPFEAYNPNPKTFAWENLERRRRENLGLRTDFSRNFSVLPSERVTHKIRVARAHNAPCFCDVPGIGFSVKGPFGRDDVSVTKGGVQAKRNCIAPFATLAKPTCGVFFSSNTDNRKQQLGIPPTDLMRSRIGTL